MRRFRELEDQTEILSDLKIMIRKRILVQWNLIELNLQWFTWFKLDLSFRKFEKSVIVITNSLR